MKFVILGGGTAGWFTALFINKIAPDHEVVVIQDPKIGIIGVGEATTPHITTFLSSIDVMPFEVIKATGGSLKAGISFENWNGDGKKYMHPFAENLSEFSVKNIASGHQCYTHYLKNLIDQEIDLNEGHYTSFLSYQNKVDVLKISYALHFDAKILAEFLEELGVKRKIKIIEGTYLEAVQDEQGFIKKLKLNGDREIEGDFFFDCTGLARELIGKLYKQKWISYKDYLPMKKAIPFWLEGKEDINPYSTATAMKNGWCWQIPLQDRIGAGYVFDSDYTDVDQAVDEATKLFGQKINVRAELDINAGRFENVWVKNCLAVGLASSFIEPLEATSIFLTIAQLKVFSEFLHQVGVYKELPVKTFNNIASSNLESTFNFIYLHYMTKRSDSEFWKNLRKNYPPPPKLAELLEKIKQGDFVTYDIKEPTTLAGFTENSYLIVAQGLDFFESKPSVNFYRDIFPSIPDYKKAMQHMSVTKAVNHREFLNMINDGRVGAKKLHP